MSLRIGWKVALALVACGGGQAQPVTPLPSRGTAAAPTTEPLATAAPSASPPPDMAPTDETPLPPPPVPTSTVATTKTDASWASCHQSLKVEGKDVAKGVSTMAAACRASTKMKKIGKTLTGKQAAQDAPQVFPFEAKAHHCYRAYAQASDGIRDLHVVMKDSANMVVGQDSADGRSPVVLEDGAVCFSQDDRASVIVSVGMGKGTYAVEVWGD